MDAAAEVNANIPMIIMGDMNIQPHLSMTLTSALHTDAGFDAALQHSVKTSSRLEHTCFAASRSLGTRIDVAMCNRVANSSMDNYRTIHDSGIPVHLLITIELNIPQYHKRVQQACKPRRIPFDVTDPSSDGEHLTASNVAANIWNIIEEKWTVAVCADDVARMWDLWPWWSEEYLFVSLRVGC